MFSCIISGNGPCNLSEPASRSARARIASGEKTSINVSGPPSIISKRCVMVKTPEFEDPLSFGALTDKQIWDLVNYVRELNGQGVRQ